MECASAGWEMSSQGSSVTAVRAPARLHADVINVPQDE